MRAIKVALAALLALVVTSVTSGIVMNMWPSVEFEVNGGALMRPFPGYANLREQTNTSLEPTPDNAGGAFRLDCRPSHMAFVDPVIYPELANKSHLHTFFGNTGVNHTVASITDLTTKGNSSCAGGIANRSAYWTPALINSATGFPVVPTSVVVYYKHQSEYRVANPNDVIWPPEGLRIIAGNPQNTSNSSPTHGEYRWDCGAAFGYEMPDESCANGEEVILIVRFPQCWDGVNLDTNTATAQNPPYNYPNDHQSHMAYENPATGCPESHPVMLPQVSVNVHYDVTASSRPEDWRLASDTYSLALSAGRSAHSDVVFGWNTDISARILNGCLKPTVPVGGGAPKGHDCHVGLLGNETPSKRLY